MAVVAFKPARKAQYLVVQLVLPGRSKLNAGVLLLDPESDTVHVRLRQDWDQIADPDEAEVLEHAERELRQRGTELGGERLLSELEDTLSQILRISDRESIAVGDFPKALERLYLRHVEGESPSRAPVLRFETHLPLYSLRAAASGFGEDMEVEAEDWLKAPEDLRLASGMFVARVVGRSMEPLIPEGSLCVFRHSVVGSRQGKLLLIQSRAASESGGEFTVKRYTSRKVEAAEGWRHERIRLEPLNPDFDAWDLDPSELENGPYRVCGEFLRVLPYEDQ